VFSFDAAGGKYEEADFQVNGSGGVHAKNWIKASWREGLSADETIDLAVRSLFAAADEDTATGGPDLVRRIFPTVAVIDADGYRSLPDDDVARRATALLGGPEEGAGE
jgi:proteasome beta subunit